MEHLKRLREKSNLTPTEAAAQLGISVTTLWRYETGKTKRYDNAVLSKMSTVYKVSRDVIDGQKVVA